MFTPNCKIKFTGLILTHAQRQAIEFIIHGLQGKSPSDSKISLQVVSGESDVNCFLRLNSNNMNFELSQNGADALSMVKLIAKDWQVLLKSWRRERILA